jgi:Ca2+-transporting ATPase
MVMIFVVVYVPIFQPIFNTVPLGIAQWLEILPLVLIPSIAAELTKVYIRKRIDRVELVNA